MIAVTGIEELNNLRRKLKGPTGFVPTMGFLHEGHLSLVREARKHNQTVIVSIFVNPAQFGPSEDFQTYPKDIKHDLEILRKEGVDIVFTPSSEEMYPEDYSTWIEVAGLTEKLEGASRPGHFKGVATIVLKLLNITRPDVVYFGQKDAQQAIVIKHLVRDLNVPVNVIVMPTIRQPDGLALSSRNYYLSKEENEAATIIYKSLRLASKLYQNGERSPVKIKQAMTELIRSEPLVTIDDISIALPENLEELDIVNGQALVSLAVWIGKTRLIDNIIL